MTLRKILPLFPAVDLLALTALCLYPIRDTPTRTAIIACTVLLLPLTLLALWKFRWPRRITLALNAAFLLLIFTIALLPGSPPAPAQLQSAYLAALRSYESSPYVWGGETHRGIDCSGLPRMAYMHATLNIAGANPALLRQAAWLWWNDSSARNFTTGFDGRLILITSRPANLTLLHPGDLAITPDGVHTLVYLGDHQWIQADPSTMTVHTSTEPDDRMRSMTIMRWNQLDSK